MSTTIDQRVVEMRFDNKQFESGVSTTMSTLEKLKQKLRLDGATKGLEDINSAANKCDMSPMAKGVEVVQTRFSALQVIGMTALANITNSAVNAGKRIMSALTVDPIKTGFQEYETQINAVQTILANTSSKGTNLEQVNQALDELNKYADKTIYNFTEMTRNIGTFTAAGIDLDTSVNAIQGIANLAAVSGSTSQQASTAMYQLSQALAAGTVKLMDWNSVVNAGMGGEMFQNALKETSELLKTGAKEAIETEGSFRESLKQGWLTAEVLTETLKKFTTTGANEYIAKYTGLSKEAVQAALDSAEAQYGEAEAIDKAAEALAKQSGKKKEEIKTAFEFAKNAEDAATKVKTFTQLIDTLKESVQSGWTQSWEIIIGDFEQAKEVFTKISDALGGVINKFSDARNEMLSTALGSPFDKIAKEVEAAGIPLDDFKKKLVETAREQGISFDKMAANQSEFNYLLENGLLNSKLFMKALNEYIKGADGVSESTEDMTDKLKKFQKVVDKVWKGEFGNGEKRIKALAEAGYDYAEVQDLVNKSVNGHKLTLDDLSDSQLKNIGYTEDQIKKIRKLGEEAKDAHTPLHELLERLEKPSGRELVIDTFKNFGKELSKIFKAVGEAWDEVFGDINAGEGIYGFIESIHELSESFTVSEEKAESFKNICKGLLDLFNISHSIVTMSLTGSIKILAAVFEVFGTNMLEVLETVAKWISKGAEWIRQNTFLMNTWKKIGTVLGEVVKAITECFNAFMKLEAVKEVIQNVKDWFNSLFDNIFGGVKFDFSDDIVTNITKEITNVKNKIIEWINGLGDSEQIGIDLLKGFGNGILEGVKMVGKIIMNITKSILELFAGELGVQSPSWKAFDIAMDFIQGFLNGISEGMKAVWESIKNIGASVIEAIKKIDFGKVLAIVFAAGVLYTIKKVADAVSAVMKPINTVSGAIGKFGDMCETIGDAVEAKLKPSKLTVVSNAVLKFAIALGILAVSVALLTKLDVGKLWGAIGAIATLTLIMGALAIAVNKWGGEGAGDLKLNTKGITTVVLAISAAVLILAGALKLMSSIDNPLQTVLMMTSVIVALGGLTYAVGKFITPKASANMAQVGKLMTSMAISIGLMLVVFKLAAKLRPEEIQNGLAAVAMIELLFLGLIAVSKLAGSNSDKAGKMMRNMSLSLLIMLGVIKIASGIDEGDLRRGIKVVAQLEILFAGMLAVARIAGSNAAKVGGSMILMAGALLLAVNVMHIAAALSMEDIVKGYAVVIALGVLFTALIAVTRIAGENAVKAGAMLLLMSGALLIVAATLFVISQMNPKELMPALGIVAVLELLFTGLVAATRGASEIEKTVLKMAIVIGILGGLIIILSLMDTQKALMASAALSLVMGSLALTFKAINGIDDTKKTLGKVAQIMAVTLVLAGIVAALSFLPNPSAALTNAAALSLLLTSFASAMLIMGKAGRISTTITKNLDNMLAVTAGLALIVGTLSFFKNTDAAMNNTIALSILLEALATSMVILGAAGRISTTVTKALPMVLGVVVGLAAILGVLAYLDVEPSIEVAAALSVLLVSLSAALFILSRIGPMVVGLDAAMVALAKLVAGIGVVMLAFAGLNKLIPGLNEFLETGLPLLELLGKALGSFIGNIVGGFMEGATSTLPDIGTNLSNFMKNADGFIKGANDIGSEVGTNVKNLAAAIVALTAADLINRMTNLMGFGDSLGKLGTQLSNFMNNSKDFIDGAKGISPEMTTGIKNLASAILELTKANVLDSFSQMFTGGTSLEDFGAQLSSFGGSLKTFSASVVGINTEAIIGAAEASKALADMASSIPNMGGMFAIFTGDNTMDLFGHQLVTFGSCLMQYAMAVIGLPIETVKVSVDAAKQLVGLANSIPNMGGMFSAFTGDNTMDVFGAQLVAFGGYLYQYSVTVFGLLTESIKTSVDASNLLVGLANSIPNMGGMFAAFTGDNTMSSFGLNLLTYGNCLRNYGIAVEGVSIENIRNSVTATQELIKLNNLIPSEDFLSKIASAFGVGKEDSFGSKIVSFGKKLAEFSKECAGIDAGQINACVEATKRLKNLINSLADTDTSGVSTFNNALATLAQANVQGFIQTFNQAIPTVTQIGGKIVEALCMGVTVRRPLLMTMIQQLMQHLLDLIKNRQVRFKAAGVEIVMSIFNGINSRKQKIVTAFDGVIKQALEKINSQRKSFVSAGKNLAAGFAAGIQSQIQTAANRAAQMAAAAEKAAEEELDINSPSKVGYGIGGFFGMGFVNALMDYADKSYEAGYEIANSARKGLDETISLMSDSINTDMDLHPTVRPILDLTEIQNGTGRLNSLFAGQSISLAGANIGVANSSLNNLLAIAEKMQNGSEPANSDVVSAIAELRGDFGSLIDAINSMSITMDGDTVVGKIIGKIDNGLGQIAAHKGRRN